MNEWCENHLTQDQKNKVYIEAIKAGFDPDDYFNAIEEDYFSIMNVASDDSMDPGIEASIDAVIERYKEE